MAYIYGSGSLVAGELDIAPGTSYPWKEVDSEPDQALTTEESLLSGLGLRRQAGEILSYGTPLVTEEMTVHGTGYCDHFYFIGKDEFDTSFQKDPILLEARFNTNG